MTDYFDRIPTLRIKTAKAPWYNFPTRFSSELMRFPTAHIR
jgi:hypothetical protein